MQALDLGADLRFDLRSQCLAIDELRRHGSCTRTVAEEEAHSFWHAAITPTKRKAL
jgi:hypothetical protein